MDAAGGIVELDGVTKTFGSHVAVRDLTLHIPRGCVYGFIGPNGAGKTTTIRMILNLQAPDRGTVRVLGAPPGPAVTDRIGYLPEERGLYRKMRVRELVLYFGRLKGRPLAELAPRADAWLERLQLREWRNKRAEELSKGMQQKVQFIATVIHEPELVILDEPFSGLDPVNAEVLTGIIQELRRSGRTVIFSTHVMEQAERLCDRVFMIARGRKVLDGTLADIRRQFGEDTVDLIGEGDPSPLRGLPGVREVREEGGRFEIDLEAGASAQGVLEALVPRFQIRSFAVRAPTLHQIFIRLAGEAGEGRAA